MICSEPLAITNTSTSENDNYATSMGIDLAQKFGVLAIGETVCRMFDEHGIFYGVIKAYRKEGKQELYTVELIKKSIIMHMRYGLRKRGGRLMTWRKCLPKQM